MRVSSAPTLNLRDAERETLEVDVLIVGAGPAGLATAIRLATLLKKDPVDPAPSIALLEKGAEIGQLGLSGAVMDPRGLRELLPDAKWDEIPSATECASDAAYYLKASGGWMRFPITPPPLKNHGNIIVSLSQLCRWLATQLEAIGGVDIFTGMPGALVLYDGEGKASRVAGVQCRDQGIGKEGEKKANFQAGANIQAKVTVLAEGPRGSLAKSLVPELGLDEGRNPQTYATGVKEIWRLKRPAPHPGPLPGGEGGAAAADRTGTVWHTMGYPFAGRKGRKHFGGGWIYFMKDGLISVGYVTYLDFDDPYLDPHREFQKFKTHPFVKQALEGAEVQDYGAKTIVGGGWFAVPRLYHDGLLLTGDTAGFTNTQTLKGIHHALKSGALAAEEIHACLKAKMDFTAEALKPYEEKVKASYIGEELWRARNFHQSFAGKGGLFWGMLKTGMHMLFGGRGLKARLPSKPDYQRYAKVADYYKDGGAPPAPEERGDIQFDGTYTFNKPTDIYHSGTTHDEDQPAHLLVRDTTICATRCTVEYQNPCERFCPAAVYEPIRDEKTGAFQRLQLNFSNCVHCKTCDIKDPYGIIDWVPPEGGGGPKYKLT